MSFEVEEFQVSQLCKTALQHGDTTMSDSWYRS